MIQGFSRFQTSPSLVGDTVILRPPRPGDWSAWARLRAESRAFLVPWEPKWPSDALSRAAFRRRLKRHFREARDDHGYAFFVFRRADRALVGGMTLSNVRRGVTQSCAVGYWVGRPYARQGLASEALKLVAGFVFDDLRLHRLEAACLPSNDASQALLRKCGFTEEGYARAYLQINGVWRDHLLFGLLSDDPRP